MQITYDNKRKDITFCTMLFEMSNKNLSSLKSTDRKFEKFYLPYLKQLLETFNRVALWCDKKTADYIKEHGLDKKVFMRVMDFSELPHMPERDQWLQLLHGTKGNVGYLLKHKTPEQWIDYMMIINAKPAVMEWAATENKFNTEYFMWLDAGSFNPQYANFWNNWTGSVLSKPKDRVRITIAPTLGKSRPKFVPRFIYDIYRKTQNLFQTQHVKH